MHRLLLALTCVFAFAARADLTLVTESTTEGKTRTVTLSSKGNKAWFELKEAEGPARTMLRDADAKKMFVIDHTRKTVVVITEEDSKVLEQRQAAFRAQMKAQLERMSPEQRKRVESTMLGGSVDGPKTLDLAYEKKKGPARKVNGFTCQDYVIKRDGKPHGEGCFMSWKDAGITADDFKGLMMRVMPTPTSSGPMQHAFEANANAPGFPVSRTVTDDAGKVTMQTSLKSISKTAVAAENFEVPKDYTERQMGAQGPAPVAPPPAPAK